MKEIERIIDQHTTTDWFLIVDDKQELIEAIEQYVIKAKEEQQELSLCENCHCMTKNVCGKCKELKKGLDNEM